MRIGEAIMGLNAGTDAGEERGAQTFQEEIGIGYKRKAEVHSVKRRRFGKRRVCLHLARVSALYESNNCESEHHTISLLSPFCLTW